MEKNLKILIKIQFIAFILNACSGDILFRTKPCEDGMIRQGNACVAATKSGVGECKDPDLNNLKKGDSVTLCDGSVGEGKLVVPSDCTKDGEQDCVAKSKFKVVNIDSLSSSDIRNGKIVAGVSGTLRGVKQCRNYSNLSILDLSYPPSNLGWNATTFLPAAVDTTTEQITFSSDHGLSTNSPIRFTSSNLLPAPLVVGMTYYSIYISNTVIQISSAPNGSPIDLTNQGTGTHIASDLEDNLPQFFDTIDDYNNNLAASPLNNPWGSTEYLCDASNFVNVTSSSAPLLPSGITPLTANRAFTQIWQDQINGLYVSNILYVNGGGRNWADAVRTCESLNGGAAGEGWRLPTQKELMQLYIHGISKVVMNGGSTYSYFWAATGVSWSNNLASLVHLSLGMTTANGRNGNTFSVLCVR